jgi:hypothetical protein
MYSADLPPVSRCSGKRVLAGVVMIGELDASSPEAVLSAASYRTDDDWVRFAKKTASGLSKSHTQSGACSSMTFITAANIE